jgi:UDP-N-acetylglucosamine 2-epimerase (non-hydrolysing)
MKRFEPVLLEYRPDAVLVVGDVNSTIACALTAVKLGVPVAHVEAGLRTHDPRRPFPEEINRRLIGQLARWHFCPTARSAENLLRAGIPPSSVHITGNTVIDALLATLARPVPLAVRRVLPPKRARHRVLVTLHRRETQGDAQRRLCRMLADLARRSDVEVLFPVHMSPAVRSSVLAELDGRDGVVLTPPLDYRTFVHALRTSDLVVTDSGGIQEEAPALGVPVLVMREKTERPEGVQAGCAVLCGTRPEGVEAHVTRLLDDPTAYRAVADAPCPYGDGTAARQIVRHLEADLSPAADAVPIARASSLDNVPAALALAPAGSASE